MIIYGSQQISIEMPSGFIGRLADNVNVDAECAVAELEFHVMDDATYEIEWVSFEDDKGNELIILDENLHDEMMSVIIEEVAYQTKNLHERWQDNGCPRYVEKESGNGTIIDYIIYDS